MEDQVKFWVVDNNTNFYPNLSKSAKGLPLLEYSDPSSISKNISEKISVPDIIFINCELLLNNNHRIDFSGIEILKWIRLRGVNNHCILYSFLSREQLMIQNPKHFIIFSPGVTFVRLPSQFDQLDYKILVSIKAPDDLSLYFKAEYKLPDNRHFFANWWGISKLWEVHKAVTNEDVQILESLESNNEYNSYNGLLARYLNGNKEKSLHNHLNTLLDEEREKYGERNRRKIDYENILNQKKHEFDFATDKLEALIDIIDFKGSKEEFIIKHEELYKEAFYPYHEINNIIEKIKELPQEMIILKEYISFKEEIEEEIKKVIKEQNRIEFEIRDLLNSNENNNIFSISDLTYSEIKDTIKIKPPKIVFVDDQADQGWSTIFQHIIYGNENESFSVIIPNIDETIDEIVNKIITTVNKTNAQLLILDLRLKGESEKNIQIDDISGIKVLKKLKNKKLKCPILITSASNKIWSYKETIKLGADAYWIKEGLDDQYKIEVSVDNYFRFLELVFTLSCSEEYSYLYRTMLPKILEIENNPNKFWWEQQFWNENLQIRGINVLKTQFAIKSDIESSLYNCFEMVKKYLSWNIRQQVSLKINNLLASAVIIHFHSVIERVHKLDDDDCDNIYTLTEKIISQCGYPFKQQYNLLFDIRNNAAHKISSTLKSIIEYFDLFSIYLFHFHGHQNPIHGDIYISDIVDTRGVSFKLRNPNLNLEHDCNFIILMKNNLPNDLIDNLKVGDKIQFYLNIGNYNYTGTFIQKII